MDLIQPGPSELSETPTGISELQTQEQRERYEAEEKKRQLFAIFRNGDVAIIKDALQTTSPIGILDADRMSLLHWASMNGHAAVVCVIVSRVSPAERAAYLDLQDAGGCTALHYASQEGHLAAAVALLYYGACIVSAA